MSRWSDAGTWVGEGLRREAFFFRRGGAQLYGSLYAAEPSSTDLGVVMCNSWGFEADQADRMMHGIAIDAVGAGGAGMTFHYPGFGDSWGDIAEATTDALVDAALAAVGEAARRQPGRRWTLGGFAFGAAVASLAAVRSDRVERLLLVQPVLRPSAYIERLERGARRAALRIGRGQDTAYGYPLPRALVESAAADDAAVAAALAAFAGEGMVVRHAEPPPEPLPERFEQAVVPGTWRFGSRDTKPLRRCVAESLRVLAAVPRMAGDGRPRAAVAHAE